MIIAFTEDELQKFKRLPKEPSDSWAFWKTLGERVNVDFTDPRWRLERLDKGRFRLIKTSKKCKYPPIDGRW